MLKKFFCVCLCLVLFMPAGFGQELDIAQLKQQILTVRNLTENDKELLQRQRNEIKLLQNDCQYWMNAVTDLNAIIQKKDESWTISFNNLKAEHAKEIKKKDKKIREGKHTLWATLLGIVAVGFAAK